MEDDTEPRPESLLPYEDWIESAMRQVVAQAVAHVAENGLPGEHHFYLTFRTDHPGVVVPPRLRAQYPQEMTIVLQHQFWDLKMDTEARVPGDSARRGDRLRRSARALRAALPCRHRAGRGGDAGTRRSGNRKAGRDAAGGQSRFVPPPPTDKRITETDSAR